MILLAIFAIGAVSAADENVTSNTLAIEDETADSVGEAQVLSYSSQDIVRENESVDEPKFTLEILDKAYQGIPAEVKFRGPSDISGSLYILGDAQYFSPAYENGTAVFNITFYNQGVNTIRYDLITDYGPSYDGELKVKNVLPLFNISVPNEIYELQSFKVNFTGPKDLNGEFDRVDYGRGDVKRIKNGKATVTINGLYAGKETIRYYYEYNDHSYEAYFKVNILKKPSIKVANSKVDYLSKKKYQVRIIDNNNRSVAGKTVTFYIYKGNKKLSTKTSRTDSKGYAKVNFNLAPGEYKVKTKYGLTSVTKNYIVKPIITTKNVQKYKRYNGLSQLVKAKNFVFQATLKKVDGKYLKGKKVKITFYRWNKNGKLFKAFSATKKTDSKGVVKFTYKRLPFKISSRELEGLLIHVKISYLKENNWGTLNVRSQSHPYYYFLDG